MAINIDGKTYRNLQQQVLQNMNDIQEIKEQGTGETYSAGDGINISDENVISVDTEVIATKEDINTYTAGYGLTFGESNEFEIDSTVVATKADIPTYTEGQGISITNNNEIKANIGYGLEFSATESDTDEIKIDIDVVATKEDIPTVPTKTSQLTNDSGYITIADVPVPTPGTGINITNGQISVDSTVAMKTDIPTYTGGTGIDITNNVIAVDNNVALKIDLVDYYGGTNVSLTPHSGVTGVAYDINVPIKSINGNSLAGTGDVSVAALTEDSFRVNLRTGNPTTKTWYYTFRAEASLDTTKTGVNCLYDYVPLGAILYCVDDKCLYSVVSIIPNGQTTIAKYDGTTTVYLTPSFVNTTVERL